MSNNSIIYHNITYLNYSDMITAYFVRLMPENEEIAPNASETLKEMIEIEDLNYGDISMLRTLLFKLFIHYATLYPTSQEVLLVADEYITNRINVMARFYATKIYDYFTKCKLNSTALLPLLNRLNAKELSNFYSFYSLNKNNNYGIVENSDNLFRLKMMMINNDNVSNLSGQLQQDFYKGLPKEYQLGVIL